MRFPTLLLDLDGTLLDHFQAIQRCHTYTMQKLGLPPPTPAQVRAAIGGGLPEAITRLVGAARLAEALTIYRPYWDATMLDDVALLPGARELLVAVQQMGGRAAIFTNKHGPSSRRICQHLGISELLVGNFGATDTPWLKPTRAFTLHALETIGATAAQTALVGDSPYDLAAAHNSGCTFYGVTTGTHSAAELLAAGAVNVFPDLPSLTPILLSRNSAGA
jgi:phosphoglycolate phosphatase